MLYRHLQLQSLAKKQSRKSHVLVASLRFFNMIAGPLQWENRHTLLFDGKLYGMNYACNSSYVFRMGVRFELCRTAH